MRISKPVKGQQGMTREVVYAVNITSTYPVSFEAPEDDEYLVEVKGADKGAVRISLARREERSLPRLTF